MALAESAVGELSCFSATSPHEAEDVARLCAFCASVPDPWSRALPLHLTASALVVDPVGRRYLLRWHARQQAWLHVGGHGDPGEDEPGRIASREAREETGLSELEMLGGLMQVAVVPVAASATEPAHEHGDLRYV
ncbi:MAG: NUDIX domain-containing protein, partial [Acidimicrobiales bacterium]